MIELFSSAHFWISVLQIVAVNLALSGNNAVVIALAARALPLEQRKQSIFWGSLAAVAIRLTLIVVAFELLRLPYMKIIGGVLLLWIAAQLFVPATDEDQNDDAPRTIFASAGYIIMLANLAMSLDNVLAVAAAAGDSNLMLVIGLVLSTIIIAFGGNFVIEVMTRFPVIYPLCALLIGYLAGEMLGGDVIVKDWSHGRLNGWQSIEIGAFRLSVPGLIGACGVFPIAKLYQILTGMLRSDEAAIGENGPLNRFFRNCKDARNRLARARILALLPFAVVIAVTYLGHPLYLYHKKRLLSQITYYGLALGMTQDEVIRIKGRPAYVAMESDYSEPQFLVKFYDIPKNKTLKDYSEWEYPVGGGAPASLEIIYSKKTAEIIQIACYSATGFCLPNSGISTGASEDEVIDKLGKPRNVRTNKTADTIDYPELNLSLLLENKRVTMLMIRKFDSTP